MDPGIFSSIHVKSKEEIIEQIQELVHRHRRRFLRTNLRPCPENCTKADVTARGVRGCPGCGSTNPEQCRDDRAFVAIATKEEVYEQFRQDIRDPDVLRHDYRDIMTLLWVLGQFDGEQPQVPEHVMDHVEVREVRKGRVADGNRSE